LNAHLQIKCPAIPAIIGPAVMLSVLTLSACRPLAAVAAVPEFVGVLARIVEEEQVARELKLTAEQKERLLELIDVREDDAVELLQLPRDEQAEKLVAFRRDSEAMGLALLSSEQRVRLTEILSRTAGQPVPRPEPAEATIDESVEPAEATIDESAEPAEADEPAEPAEAATDEPAEPAEAAIDEPAEPESTEDEPTEPAEVAVDPSADQPPDMPDKLVFQFRYQPWKDVIEWFAEQADLSYVGDASPPGTFNYTDSREYTASEAIDLLNSVLLIKGYTLVRRERMLMLINLEDGIPPNLISTIPLEQLDERGEYSLVSVLFQLDKVSAEEAEEEIQKLIGPQGSVVTLPKSRQLLVTETAGRLRAIRSVIQRIEDPQGFGEEKMQTFDIKYAMPDDVLTVIRQLLSIEEEGNATADGSLRFALDPSGNRLLANGKPEVLKRLEEILEVIDMPGPGQLDVNLIDEVPQLEVYSITTADPESVLSVMQTLLAGMPDVRLSLDPKTDNLVALARPSEQATIRATLDQMQRDARLIEVIHLSVVDPQMAVLSINKLFNAAGEDAAKNAPLVDADPVTRQLLVRGTSVQIEQIRMLLSQMGESEDEVAVPGAGGTVRMLPLTGRAANSVLQQIQQLWPTMHNNPIRIVTPSAVAPTLRSGNLNELKQDEQQSPGKLAPMPGTLSPRMPAPWRPDPTSRSPQEPKPEERRDYPSREYHRGPPSDRSTGLSSGGRVFFAVQTLEAESQPLELQPPEPQPPEPQPPEPQPPEPQPPEPQPPEPQPPEPQPPEPQPPEPPVVVPPMVEPAVVVPEPAAEQPQTDEPPIIVAPGPGGVMIACQDPKVLDEFEALLTSIADGLANSGPELTIFYLKYATATVVAQTLDQILGGGTIATEGSAGGGLIGDLAGAALGDGIMGALLGLGGSGGTIAPTGAITVTPDPRLNALIVQANPVDLDMIEQVLKILDQKESPEEILVVPKAKIIPIFNMAAADVAEIVQQVYQDRMVTGSRGGSSGGRPPSAEDIMKMLRGGKGGSRGSQGQAEELQKMSIGVDAGTNSLIVSAPEPLLSQVEGLIAQLDQMTLESNTETVRTITLHQTSHETMQQALSSLMGNSVQFGASGKSSGSRPSSSRPSSSQSDDARRAFFIEMMKRRMPGGGGPPGMGSGPRPGGGGPLGSAGGPRPGGGGPPSGGGRPPGR